MTWCGKRQVFLLAILILSFGFATGIHAQSKFVTTRGKDLISKDGKPLQLKGINLGNWLLPEG